MSNEIIDTRDNYPWPATTATYDAETHKTTVRSYFGANSHSDSIYPGRVMMSDAELPEESLGKWMANVPPPVDLRSL